jgi:hypothetical protein
MVSTSADFTIPASSPLQTSTEADFEVDQSPDSDVTMDLEAEEHKFTEPPPSDEPSYPTTTDSRPMIDHLVSLCSCFPFKTAGSKLFFVRSSNCKLYHVLFRSLKRVVWRRRE